MPALAPLVFIDEVGSPELDHIDPEFPLFGVAMVVCDSVDYVTRIVPAFMGLKVRHFGTELPILHSRDIRKAQGDFAILGVASRRTTFLAELSATIEQAPFRLILVFIKKDLHREQRGAIAHQAYSLALDYALDELLPELGTPEASGVNLILEARGKKEDGEVAAALKGTLRDGTQSHSPVEFAQHDWRIAFADKKANVIGTQLADLVLYPAARHILNPVKSHPNWETVRRKVCANGRGLKVFP